MGASEKPGSPCVAIGDAVVFKFIPDDGGNVICVAPDILTSASHERWPENRRRIAASWNACIGISTESLERIHIDPPSFNKAAEVEPRFLVQILMDVTKRREVLGLTQLVEAHPHNKPFCEWLRDAKLGDGWQRGKDSNFEIWRVA